MVLIAFLKEFSRIKGTILQQFLSNQDFVDLVTNSKDHIAPYLNLRYTQVFPYPWIDDTISEEKSFVCFDLDSTKVNSQTIKTINLTVWQFSHENLMKMANGTRTDILSSCIDEILNGFVGAGASQIELTGTRRISPAKRFYGRQLEYTIKDINRWCSG